MPSEGRGCLIFLKRSSVLATEGMKEKSGGESVERGIVVLLHCFPSDAVQETANWMPVLQAPE